MYEETAVVFVPTTDTFCLSDPPSVKLPEVVTVPVRVNPLTVPVPPTDVTVPVPGAAMEVQVGTPPVTVNTWLVVPILSLASVVVVLA